MIRRSNKIVPKVAREYIDPWWRCFSGIAELLDQMEIRDRCGIEDTLSAIAF
jgi:hypothetical protein